MICKIAAGFGTDYVQKITLQRWNQTIATKGVHYEPTQIIFDFDLIEKWKSFLFTIKAFERN